MKRTYYLCSQNHFGSSQLSTLNCLFSAGEFRKECSMFQAPGPWSAPPAAAPVQARAYGEWTTGDELLDQRMAQLGGISQEAAEQFMQLPPFNRLKIGQSTVARQPPITNLNSWILGCIRKHHEANNHRPAGCAAGSYNAIGGQPLPTPARACPYNATAPPPGSYAMGLAAGLFALLPADCS